MLSTGLLDRFLGREEKKKKQQQAQRPPSRRDPSVHYGSSSSVPSAPETITASGVRPSVEKAPSTTKPEPVLPAQKSPILAGVVEPFPNWVREQLNDPLNYHQQQHFRPNEGDDMDILAGNLYG